MELKKKGIVFGILLLWLLPLIIAGTEYTPSSETNCDVLGKCTLIQYSGVQYVQEDGGWKHFQSARSLKDKGFEVSYIEDDKDYVIDVLDFNASSVTLNLNPDGIVFLNQEIPLRVWTANQSKQKEELVGDFKQDYLKIDESLIDFNIFKQSETLTLDAKLGDIIEFGLNSTTIVLWENGNHTIKDTVYAQSSPNTNYGTDASYPIKNVSASNDTDYIIISWNTSIIPPSATIERANISLQVNANGLDVSTEGYNMTTYWVYANFSWNETTATWNNNRPNTSVDMLTTERNGYYALFGGAGEIGFGEWFDLDVTNLTNYSYFNNEKNFTALVVPFETFGTPLIADTVTINLRNAGASQRPKLTITYSIITAPGGSCTYTSGDWNINTHDNCTISANVDMGGNDLVLNGSGTIVMNANITNKASLVMSSGSKFVLANGVRLG